jgi:hypothetical protein
VRTAVVHVDPDPRGTLSSHAIHEGVRALQRRGVAVHRHVGDRELELLVDSTDPGDARRRTVTACAGAFGTAPSIGAVTFISRGTAEDALGVVAGFAVRAQVERVNENGEEIAVVTLAAADRRRVPESRLHTALEAALNCEVRLVFA